MTTQIHISGQVQGTIWMPAATCTKEFSVSEDDFRYSDGSRPTLRDMVLQSTNDGDFRVCNFTNGHLVIERTVMLGISV